MEFLSEEEDQFFDTREDCPSVSDSGSESPDNLDSDFGAIGSLPGSIDYEVWIKNPGCIHERRIKFLKWMGLDVDHEGKGDPGYTSSNEVEVETDRIMEHSDAVLRSRSLDDGPSSSQSSMSSWSNDAQELLDGAMEENLVFRIGNLDNGTEFIPDELRLDDKSGRVRGVGSNRLPNVAEFERSRSSHLARQVMRREVEDVPNLGLARKQVKMGWLRRLGAVACIVDRQVESGGDGSYPVSGARNQIVRVKSYQKRSKEFSALYMRQDIPAHEGSILTMKFSPDGQYLASAGEDGVVRVWQVMEKERSDEFGTLDIHSSHAHFTINDLSVAPLKVDTEKKGQFKSMRTSDPACVIFPQRVFQISDKPIHEFFGHCGDVLDLSWSKDRYLLSSSVDKTVRLWKVGCDKCQQVFFHNDYVTCVQFNPVDENYFISGSIDGKVRIWAIPGCQVVDWTDITEIVTAVCYCPDGKGGIVGSMNGNCRFYDASDNRLQQSAQICLQGKKKSPSKRITGFQFSPSEPTRLMVTSADNQVRILHGVDVICKYRGLRNAGSQISASFTSDGMHIVSASEDSNVYIWNSVSQNGPVDQVKSKWSCEHFFSNSVSVAIPWCGMTSMNCSSSNVTGKSPSSTNSELCSEKSELLQSELVESSQWKLPFSSTENLSLSHCYFPHSLPKGSATWPAENLPGSSLVVSSALCKSQYKFLKMSCQSMHGSPHAWGLVIVTAGWDGTNQIIPELWITISIERFSTLSSRETLAELLLTSAKHGTTCDCTQP
ncbi:hypothetical protein OIU85_020516 [Salix viminalis]|uniref:Uncharacterized protein n=1 Tax=Salix viminalis TaxID=40686 RepID=A0A9Q0ZCK5_SALVM|nr:hypothetical protein OIU85_020516 [Salix viminalis]